LPVACFIFARLVTGWQQHRWALYSRVTGFAFLVLFVVTTVGFLQVQGLVDYAGLFQRITLSVGWAWLSLLAFRLLRDPATGETAPSP
jgi:hypothetical protein